jgi:F0F1-type ATP synthase epsilon subunit
MAKKLLNVIVRDAQSVVFDGQVDRISSYNQVGRFDIYPMHANFISIIRDQITFYFNNKVVKDIKIEQAVLKVKKDMAQIFLGIEELFVDEK